MFSLFFKQISTKISVDYYKGPKISKAFSFFSTMCILRAERREWNWAMKFVEGSQRPHKERSKSREGGTHLQRKFSQTKMVTL